MKKKKKVIFFFLSKSMDLRVKCRFPSETEGKKSGHRFRVGRKRSVGEEEFSMPFEVLPAGLRVKLT